MESRIVVLKLFLDALGIPSKIADINDRKRIQKAIYLGQLTGVDLGYRFGWYLKGPYCPELARDYYSLYDAIASHDTGCEGKELKPLVQKRLERLKPLLKVPRDLNLEQHDWLELLASYDYLCRVRGRSPEDAATVLKKEKPSLAPYLPQAREQLVTSHLIDA